MRSKDNIKHWFFTPIIAVYFFILLVSNTSAQGTYRCWPDMSTLPGVCRTTTNCDPGYYSLPSNCYSLDMAHCGGTFACSPTDWDSINNAVQSKGGVFSFSRGVTIGSIISALLSYIFPIAGLILLIIIVVSGIKMMTSGGDPKKIAGARSTLTSGLIGFIIIFTAYWITYIIGNILGLSDIRQIF